MANTEVPRLSNDIRAEIEAFRSKQSNSSNIPSNSFYLAVTKLQFKFPNHSKFSITSAEPQHFTFPQRMFHKGLWWQLSIRTTPLEPHPAYQYTNCVATKRLGITVTCIAPHPFERTWWSVWTGVQFQLSTNENEPIRSAAAGNLFHEQSTSLTHEFPMGLTHTGSMVFMRRYNAVHELLPEDVTITAIVRAEAVHGGK